jgi:hypothetical protein
MNLSRLGPLRTIPLHLEDAVGVPVFLLVSPHPSYRSDYAVKPIVGDYFRPSLPHIFSVSVGTGRCLRLCFLLVIYELLCLLPDKAATEKYIRNWL